MDARWADAARVLLGLRAAPVERPAVRFRVGLLTVAPFLAGAYDLGAGLATLLALACLPLARAQAGLLWTGLVSLRATESLAARLSPDRELIHKQAWAALFLIDAGLALRGHVAAFPPDGPIAVAPYLAPLAVLTLVCFAERALGRCLRARPVTWSWLSVFLAACWEEVIFRGALVAVLAPALDAPALVVVAAVLFGLPHYERGRPSGVRGVAFASGLGVITLVTGLWAGSLWPGIVIHAVGCGTFALVRSRRAVRAARGDLSPELALFLIRLPHAYYVTDWAGERIRPLAPTDGRLPERIREHLRASGEPAALAAWTFAEALAASETARDSGRTGREWLRRWGSYLVIATPAGTLPPVTFPSIGLALLRAVAKIPPVAAPPQPASERQAQRVRTPPRVEQGTALRGARAKAG